MKTLNIFLAPKRFPAKARSVQYAEEHLREFFPQSPISVNADGETDLSVRFSLDGLSGLESLRRELRRDFELTWAIPPKTFSALFNWERKKVSLIEAKASSDWQKVKVIQEHIHAVREICAFVSVKIAEDFIPAIEAAQTPDAALFSLITHEDLARSEKLRAAVGAALGRHVTVSSGGGDYVSPDGMLWAKGDARSSECWAPGRLENPCSQWRHGKVPGWRRFGVGGSQFSVPVAPDIEEVIWAVRKGEKANAG